ncbi:hypothetical protein SEA_WOLLYPOG_12 [Arthrobacter phage Wollypog]|uniref:Uncharacterized protein n=1 Tax=Arthrobacter phage Wollypog TaxID=2790985 RepID=A0A7T3KCG5_9CAUD|nr:hypothetical protein PP291_gp12 [Arthrobacter phage Wollypog]QPX62565.1 hypothetical protein SEA_WOLLYPOG_12 [Arthrobacter phage Wollypog]
MASTRTSRTAAETAADTTPDVVAETPAPAPTVGGDTAAAPQGTTTEEATADAPAGSTRVVAQFVGHAGTERIITKKDQDRLIGTDGVAKRDLVWAPGNSKLDVTDVDEDVIAYLKSDEEFKLREIEVQEGE